jgi:hypothetical protein
MPLQEWIHKLEEGTGAIWIKRLFVFLAFAGLAALYDVRQYKNFSNPEAMDSAQIARQIAEGHGFATKFIRPLSINLIQKHQGEMSKPLTGPHPDLANAPMFPLVEAALFKILPFNFTVRSDFWRYQPEVFLAIFNQLLFAILLWSVFVLARRLFDASVAGVTVAVLALAELFWRFSISGLPTIFLTLITVWIVWCLSQMETRTREQTATDRWFYTMSFAVAALLTVGALTRYSYGFLIVPIVAFAVAFFGARKGASVAIIVVLFLVALAPWCYRNYTICGQPFGIAQFAPIEETALFPKDRFQRSMPQNLRYDLNKVTPDQYARKLKANLNEIIRDQIPKLGGSWATALFLVGLLAPFRNPGLSRLRWFLLASMATLAIVQSLGRTQLSDLSPEINSENLLVLLAPIVFMYGIALFYSFIDQIPFEFPHYRTAAIGAFVVVVSAPLIMVFASGRNIPFAYPPYYPPYLEQYASWLSEDEMAMGDMPWAMAWYGDRTCLWNTLDTGYTTPSDFFAIHDHIKPIKLVYLTPLSLDVKFVNEMLKGRENAWSRFALDCMVRTNVPPGFPLKHSPRGYLPDFLVLSDRKRW